MLLSMTDKKYNPLLLVVIYGDMVLYGFVQSMRGVTFPLIKNGFAASYSEQGLMTAILSFTAVCFCVIPGMFMGRFGLKKTIAAGFIVMSLGMASLYTAGSFWMAAGLLMLFQAGQGFFEIGLNGMGVRIFTVKPGLMMILLHFFFGAGAIAGPRFAGLLTNNLALSWQHVYPLALFPVAIMAVVSMLSPFPGKMKNEMKSSEKNKDKPSPDEISFWAALKEPMVWIFGLIMGIAGSIEACSVSWSGLYYQDVFGMEISSEGAAFISAFFVFYTLSRLLGGFFVEKLGLIRITITASLAIPVLLIASFCLGRPGVYLLPVSGIFVALVYPAILAISIGVFKEKAQAMSPAIISIAFVLNGIAQFGFGISNRFLGPSWAYRSCVVYGAILLVLTLRLRTILKNPEAYPRFFNS
jgi:fucose permease